MDNTLSFSLFTFGHETNLEPLPRIEVFPRPPGRELRALTLEALDGGARAATIRLGPLLDADEIRAILARRDQLHAVHRWLDRRVRRGHGAGACHERLSDLRQARRFAARAAVKRARRQGRRVLQQGLRSRGGDEADRRFQRVGSCQPTKTIKRLRTEPPASAAEDAAAWRARDGRRRRSASQSAGDSIRAR